MTRPTLYLLVGLPASGKTTRARELEAQHGAVRFSPDEWMIPLFGESDAGGKRDVLEARLISTALRLLQVGVSVVLDFGFWGRDERSALRWLAGSLGAAAAVEYLPVTEAEQWRRIEARYAATPNQTFPLGREDLAGFRALFQPPDAAELAGRSLPAPAEDADWREWSETRWPSLDRGG